MPNPSLKEIEQEGDLIRRSQLLKRIVKSESLRYEELDCFLRTQIRRSEKKAWRRFCKKILVYLNQQEDQKQAEIVKQSKSRKLRSAVSNSALAEQELPSPFGVPLKFSFYLGLACWIIFLFQTLDQNQGLHTGDESILMASGGLPELEPEKLTDISSVGRLQIVTRLQTLKTKARDPLSGYGGLGRGLRSQSFPVESPSQKAFSRSRSQHGVPLEQGLRPSHQRIDISKILRKAREGEVEFQAIMGGLYVQGEQVEKNYHKAFQWYLRASVQGHAQAQNDLAALYYKGHGVPKDYREAIKWWKLSAEKNYAVAQNNLGYLYEKGQGVEKDNSMAANWYLRAAEQGYHKAQNNLAVMYDQGRGVPELPEAAVQWWLRAAEQDYSKAQNNLGVMYFQGRGVEKDFSEALKWWNLSARHGYARAQNNLGIMYEEGTGVEKDIVMAYAWLSLAFMNGYDQASRWRSELELRMTPVQQAMAQELIYGKIDAIPAPVTDY
jgi:TPR repeat protein